MEMQREEIFFSAKYKLYQTFNRALERSEYYLTTQAYSYRPPKCDSFKGEKHIFQEN